MILWSGAGKTEAIHYTGSSKTLNGYCMQVQAGVDPPYSPRMAQQQSTCTVLEGQFSWAATARVVHRVCRVGRDLKTACSKEILGVWGGQCGEGGGTGRTRKHGTPEGMSKFSPVANRDPHHPQAAKHGRRLQPARRSRRIDNTGGRDASTDHNHDHVNHVEAAAAVTTTNRPRRRLDGDTNTAETVETADNNPASTTTRTEGCHEGEEEEQQRPPPEKRSEHEAGSGNPADGKQPEQAEGPEGGAAGERADKEDKPPPRATLSKEAAFLKAAEDTDGGQGAMLFSEFVEALTRLCLARYGPRVTDRRAQGVLAAAGSATASGGGGGGGDGAAVHGKAGAAKKLGIGGRKAVTTLKMSFAGKPVARGRTPNVSEGRDEYGHCFWGCGRGFLCEIRRRHMAALSEHFMVDTARGSPSADISIPPITNLSDALFSLPRAGV